jgi:hypothetical protein
MSVLRKMAHHWNGAAAKHISILKIESFRMKEAYREEPDTLDNGNTSPPTDAPA